MKILERNNKKNLDGMSGLMRVFLIYGCVEGPS